MGAVVTPAPIRLENLTLGYDRRPAVHHLDGIIAPGETLAICGPNGAGKSTLLKALAGALAPMGGRIDRCGAAARDVAYLPQALDIDRDFPIFLRDFVSLGALGRCGLFGRIGAGESARIDSAIAAVGLSGLEDRTLDTLSGGQLQRALFARLIVQDKPIILLDEPFGAIDEATREALLALIDWWRAEGRTVVAVLHEIDIARRAFATALLLARDPICWGAAAETLCDANIAKARRMAEAYDRAARECLRDEERAHDH